MRVEDLRLTNVRNHEASRIRFHPGVNVLVGDNGEGKTSVLEAVSLLCLTKSFSAAGDSTILRRSSEAFSVEGSFRADGDTHWQARLCYTAAVRRKDYSINGVPVESMASVIGRFPVVVLAPEYAAITTGGPAERRRFVDMLLSQVSRAYLQDLLEYRRILRQRNRLLAFTGPGTAGGEELEVWDAGLVRAAARLMVRRSRVLEEFRPFVRDAYGVLARTGEDADLTYVSSPALARDAGEASVEAELAARLVRVRGEERRRRVTLVGPHRDDVALEIGGLAVRPYASQGQHKSMLIALKIAEFHYLRDRTGEQPLLLLDDVFSELDPARARRLGELVRDLGQTLVTTTDDACVRDIRSAQFEVRHGTISETAE